MGTHVIRVTIKTRPRNELLRSLIPPCSHTNEAVLEAPSLEEASNFADFMMRRAVERFEACDMVELMAVRSEVV